MGNAHGLRGGVAAAHDGNAGFVQPFGVAAQKQHGRRGDAFGEHGGVIAVAREHQAAAGLLFPLQRGFGGGAGEACVVPFAGGLFGVFAQLRDDFGGRLQGGAGGAIHLQQNSETFRADVGRESQLQPCLAFGFGHEMSFCGKRAGRFHIQGSLKFGLIWLARLAILQADLG